MSGRIWTLARTLPITIAIPVSFFLLLQWQFGYTLEQFWTINVEYNRYYAAIGHSLDVRGNILYRPQLFKVMVLSLLGPASLLVVWSVWRGGILSAAHLIGISAVVVAVLAFVYTRSNKTYHSFIVVPVVFAFVAYFVSDLTFRALRNALAKAAIWIWIVAVCAVALLPAVKGVHRLATAGGNLMQTFFPDDLIIVKHIVDGQPTAVIGARAWPFVATGARSEVSMQFFWFYYGTGFSTPSLERQHASLLRMQRGTIFVDRELLLSTSTRLDELLACADRDENITMHYHVAFHLRSCR